MSAAYGQISAAQVAALGLFAGDAALRDAEYLDGLVDEARIRALTLPYRIQCDMANYWHDFEARAVSVYVIQKMVSTYSKSLANAHRLTTAWLDRKLSRESQRFLWHLQDSLDRRRAEFCQQREAELRAEVAAWERAALARIRKQEAPAAVLAEAA